MLIQIYYINELYSFLLNLNFYKITILNNMKLHFIKLNIKSNNLNINY